MLKDCVLILGSGKSILELTKTERELLNSCEVKIGMNKYAAFYELSGIVPSHIYFVDDYDSSSRMMLSYIFKLLRKNNCEKRTFIVSNNYKGFLFSNYFVFIFNTFINNFKIQSISFLVNLGRLVLKRINVSFFNKCKFFLENEIKINPVCRYSILPKQSKIQYVETQDWKMKGNKWSISLEEPLYHFKGSFSTVLNYISISYPTKTILLAGVDFNSSDYFFEEELEKLNFDTKDWTYEIKKSHNKHFSIIETDGVKMDDELPFMLNELENSSNKIYSLNKSSYLVEQKYIEFISLNDLLTKKK